MPATLNDEDLIRIHWSGKPTQCMAILYQRYCHKIYCQCLSMTRDQNVAQDFTHDIFLKLYDKMDTFQQKARMSTWLYSIARNYCLDQLRSTKRQTLLDEQLKQILLAESAEEIQKEELIQRAWQYLPQESQQLLHLKYEEGLSYEVLSSQFNLSISSLKMRLLRARRHLQQNYSRLAQE